MTKHFNIDPLCMRSGKGLNQFVSLVGELVDRGSLAVHSP